MTYDEVMHIIKATKKPKGIFKLDLPSYLDEVQNKSIELISDDIDEKEILTLDVSRYGLQIKRNKTQLRHNKINIMLRLDIYSTHTNPEFNSQKAPKELSELMDKYSAKKFLKEAHLHFYIDGYNDKWAFPLSEFGLEEKEKFIEMVETFCKFCNIIGIKFTYGSLF